MSVEGLFLSEFPADGPVASFRKTQWLACRRVAALADETDDREIRADALDAVVEVSHMLRTAGPLGLVS